MISQFHYLYCS